MNIMHRDLHLEYVMTKWFVIDFDDSCKFPSNIPNTQKSHAPEVSKYIMMKELISGLWGTWFRQLQWDLENE